MQLKSNALPNLIWRLKPAIDPATRFFLVALFIVGFTSSYFGDLRSKTDPQYAANADVENHPSKPAIVFVHAGWHHVRSERWECAWLEARQRYARN
jgi:hypothetical protein